ncbi:TAXI family TRAP transporter solute-binding subunit [Zavarzinia sp.]|uniref:TAXI family TRAP transporter solute-binding subunit n=1 Tax=Zavarzinia sp. TaxID=2027920 RepID=UPI0035618361
MRRIRAIGAAGLAALLLTAGSVLAGEASRYFQIATAGASGTYFPVGQMLATAVSGQGAEGVPGLVASAVASNGSLANVEALEAGSVDSALVQADVGHWAVTGTGAFETKGKREALRAIAALYPETVHLLVRKDSGITKLDDLKGHHVSIDEPGSGTLVDVRLILAAYRMTERDFVAEYYKPDLAAQLVAMGQLDGFFFVGGYPSAAIEALAARAKGDLALVAIDGHGVNQLLADNPFFTRASIPVNVYAGLGPVDTVAVRALWLTSAAQPAELIQAITAALWSESGRKALDSGHIQGKAIRLETALDGLTVPLHPGAEAFYREKGQIK